MRSYGKFGRILLEIAPVNITETCLHKGAEGDKWEGWCEHGQGEEKRAAPDGLLWFSN